MAIIFIQVPPNSTGEKVAAVQLFDGTNNVDLQKCVFSSPSTFGNDAEVLTADPTASSPGLVVRPARTPCTTYHLVSAATTNANSIKASAGVVYGWDIFNNAAYPVFVKLFNKATAPTLGTDTPLETIGVQAGTPSRDYFDRGINFSTGIAIAITKVITDADATAVALNDCVVNLLYL